MSGHGHVIPRPDGVKARCGGPAMCSECATELAGSGAVLGRTRPLTDPLAAGHAPAVTRVSTIEVACAATGPEQPGLGDDHSPWRQYTLADIEAWCAELRRLGAGDCLVLDQADGLVVTLDVS